MDRRGIIVGCGCLVASLTAAVQAADIFIVPVSASGTHTIAGNDITLSPGGQRVFFEVFAAGWDPALVGTPQLKAWQAVLDSSGYTAGTRGALTPALVACSGVCSGGINNGLTCINDDDCNTCVGGANDGLACAVAADCPLGVCQGTCDLTAGDTACRAAFGGACGGATFTPGAACVTDADCPDIAPPSFVGVCDGAACAFPTGTGGFCEPGFILTNRIDYVYVTVDDVPAVDLSSLNFRYASAVQTTPVADPGIPQYLGTLVLDVSPDATGTFEIGLQALPDTVLQDQNDSFITPLNLVPARVIIPCSVDADCNDGNACTNDSCRRDGVCVNTPNFNEATFCCRPSDRTLTQINDLNDCTNDICDSTSGTVTHPPLALGTACGDPGDTACDNPDTCDGAGTCNPNFEPSGFACGSPADTDCDNPDTCDGAGTCLVNNEPDGPAPVGLCNDANECTQDRCQAGVCANPNEPFGTACGDPTDTDCDNPDTCNGAGTCLANNEPDGTAPAGLCNDGNDCTLDNCLAAVCANPNAPVGAACGNPSNTDCDNPDTCDGAGVCLTNNEPDGPAPPGLCNDGNDCTQDTCATGVCAHPNEATGTACGDPSDTGCDNPDTCDGAGVCLSNLEPPSTPCGDPSNTDCTDPDTCDGAGVCLPNHALPGTACGDPTNTDCDNPDTCDGGGTCLANLEPDGTTCNDGLFCNVGEVCAAGLCGGGAPRDCNDGLACTTDTCNEGAGTCDNTINAGACLISGVCRTAGELNPAVECEACDPAVSTSAWSFRPSGDPCGNPANTDCTDPDTCDGAGVCQANHALPGTACGDPTNNDCDNPDTCDGGGVCLVNFEPNGTTCNDGLFCNVNESCTAGVCGGGGGRDCSDGVPCTDDSCDEVNDRCVSVVNDANCDNGRFCDGVEICDAVQNCITQAGSIPNPDDGVGCTDDSCDEVNDVLVHAPNDTLCDNGQFCDGVEVCDPVQDCITQPGSVPDPDDGVGCTDDSCDEVNDVLVHAPNDSLCPDDTLFCNGNEFCDPIDDCSHTGSPCGGPCDEAADVCLCEAPLVDAVGERYLRITIQPPGSGPQAIVITPDCPGAVPQIVCPPRPIDIDGDGLMDETVAELRDSCPPGNRFLTAAQWGELYVFGKNIVPETTYVVQGDCGSPGVPGLSDSTLATTPIFGDTVGVFVGGQWTPPDGSTGILDIIAIVDRVRALPTAPSIARVDLAGVSAQGLECVPDQNVKFVFDVIVAIDAFRGLTYRESTSCRTPCP